MRTTITAECTYVPGHDSGSLLAAPPQGAVDASRVHEQLGRRGLGSRDAATRYALAATQHTLGLPPGRIDSPIPGAAGTAVVVASTLGNMETLCDISDGLTQGGKPSALNVPNASSNIIASAVALRFGFTGPNILIANGATSGLDAIRVGRLLLTSGRAHRVVVVGSEPADDVASTLKPGITEGAACVILEADHDEAPLLESVTRPTQRPSGAHLYDQDTFGAAGVIEVAIASARARQGQHSEVWCGDDRDGYLCCAVAPAEGSV